MRGLLNLKDLSTDKIVELIKYAEKLKKGFRIQYPDKKIATMFFENSTRTHYSFQCALMNLGIKVLDINTETSSVKKGETLYDTVRTLEALGLDGVVIRHSQDGYYEELKNINIPIFNAGDGKKDHPTQSLLDLMTIHEEFGKFEGLKCCIIGDISHSRVAHTNVEIMQRLGMEVYISGPKEFDDKCAPFMDIEQAVQTCDVIMLLRVQFERHTDKMGMSVQEYHEKYGLTSERVSRMKDNAIIMHPAPINRGVEIADEVAECPKSRIYKQMTNGVYVRMAIISDALDGNL